MSTIKNRKIFAGIALAAVAAFPLAACSSSSDSAATSASGSKTTVAKPLARLNDLSTGGTTAIAL
ncbi:MAG: hypothetical protein H7290_01215, partial [Flavobacterium sp.]|nr:hypothetical protein [Aeromicrobium sp.]